jgi:hypothetical protein
VFSLAINIENVTGIELGELPFYLLDALSFVREVAVSVPVKVEGVPVQHQPDAVFASAPKTSKQYLGVLVL